jgi:hypothetical protein
MRFTFCELFWDRCSASAALNSKGYAMRQHGLIHDRRSTIPKMEVRRTALVNYVGESGVRITACQTGLDPQSQSNLSLETEKLLF